MLTISCAHVRKIMFARRLIFATCLLPLAALGATRPAAGEDGARPLEIRFDELSPTKGLTLSVVTRGDRDGSTTFSNTACCGIKSAMQFVQDVRAYSDKLPLVVTQVADGWEVRHAPGAAVRLNYRLPPSGPMKIDVGVPEQLRPIVDRGSFHVIGTFGLLLPTGRRSEQVDLAIDASRAVSKPNFVSSFGSGTRIKGVHATLGEVAKAVYIGGSVALSLHRTPSGTVAIVYSGMEPGFQASDFSRDALAVLAAERKFFDDGQAWFLVSLRGGAAQDPVINLGGGMGLTNSFAMFARSDLNARSREHREQFNLVLAHEYFHNWNGLTLRVAKGAGGKGDDASVYWFSEGVTEFYTLRTLTRLGLLSPQRALRHLNSKIEHYETNKQREVDATTAGSLFWADPDGEQIPYLRGYLASWVADQALMRASSGARGLDDSLRALVARGEAEEDFRVDNRFLVAYLTKAMSAPDAAAFSNFVLEGGAAPLVESSFAPCLAGHRTASSESTLLQYEFAQPTKAACFRH